MRTIFFYFRETYRQRMKASLLIWGGLLVGMVATDTGHSLGFERRPVEPFETSWLIYPIFSRIPGIGELGGLGATVSGIAGTPMDVTAITLRGQGLTGEPLSVNVFAALDVPLFTPMFTLSAGVVDVVNGTVDQYERGRDSKKENRIILKALRLNVFFYEFAVHLFEDQLEFYVGRAETTVEPDAILRPIGGGKFRETKIPESERGRNAGTRFGVFLDDTDSRRDPRIGYRIQYELYNVPGFDETPSFSQHDYNLTGFIPTNRKRTNVLVLNAFYGTVVARSKGKVLPERYQCPPNAPPQCQIDLDQLRAEAEINATLGRATSLGGTNRLRSYPAGRFYDTHTLFFGIEDRFYVLEDYQPFNYFVQKGIFTGLQLAAFLEFGQVGRKADATLLEDMKSSYGVGLRVLLNTVIIRIDYATGAEGAETTVFVGYPF